MSTIQLHELIFEPFIDEKAIKMDIKNLAQKVQKNYSSKQPIFISVLNGAFRFTSTFMNYYDGDCEISFIRVKSYEGTNSTGAVMEVLGLDRSIEGRDIVLMEDIVDTGETIAYLWNHLQALKPASICIVSLFFKPDVYNKKIPIDFIGRSIPNKFIVGFGLDYNELGRNLNAIYQKKE